MNAHWDIYLIAAVTLLFGFFLIFGGIRIRKKGNFYDARRGVRGYWKDPVLVSDQKGVNATSRVFIITGIVCVLFSLLIFVNL